MIRYRGLTWDHPRGFNALAAAARRLEEQGSGIAIDWDRQPLEGFESHPLQDLCARYDLVVLDHPHVGEAVAAGCLVPLEEMFGAGQLAAWERDTIGPCFTSYRYAGRRWALPLDAATQVMVLRPDLEEGPPATWDDVVALSARVPVALSLAGPHAFLTFLSLAVAFGEPPAEAEAETLVSAGTGMRVLEVMATLYARMPPQARTLNPIGLLEAMAAGDDVRLCPLVYGYVTYATPSGGRRLALRFLDAPTAAAGGRPGSTLGGTGIGVSRACRVTPELTSHLAWLLSSQAQVTFIPAHEGQPSRREAWYDAALNDRCGRFFERTASTVERAYVRPRHDGYIGFQAEASGFLRDALDARAPHRRVLDRLQAGYAASRRPGAER